jgi:predicted RNA-binding Zn-ribbon protein involved in translation (DUF1610 family)
MASIASVILPSLAEMFPEHLSARAQASSRTGSPLPPPPQTHPHFGGGGGAWHADLGSFMQMPSWGPHSLSLEHMAPRTHSHSSAGSGSPEMDMDMNMALAEETDLFGMGGDSHSRHSASEARERDADAADGAKKHMCPTCGKRFLRPSSLRIHANTHTGAQRESRLSRISFRDFSDHLAF